MNLCFGKNVSYWQPWEKIGSFFKQGRGSNKKQVDWSDHGCHHQNDGNHQHHRTMISIVIISSSGETECMRSGGTGVEQFVKWEPSMRPAIAKYGTYVCHRWHIYVTIWLSYMAIYVMIWLSYMAIYVNFGIYVSYLALHVMYGKIKHTSYLFQIRIGRMRLLCTQSTCTTLSLQPP